MLVREPDNKHGREVQVKELSGDIPESRGAWGG